MARVHIQALIDRYKQSIYGQMPVEDVIADLKKALEAE